MSAGSILLGHTPLVVSLGCLSSLDGPWSRARCAFVSVLSIPPWCCRLVMEDKTFYLLGGLKSTGSVRSTPRKGGKQGVILQS